MKKQARIRLDVVVPIEDDELLPDGMKRVAMKVMTKYVETVKEMIQEGCKDSDRFDTLLDAYVDLRILQMLGVRFQPLTTVEAMKIEDCVIEEIDEKELI